MARYEYRCVRHGAFEVTRPIGDAADPMRCPICDEEATRVFSPPMVALANKAIIAAIDRTEKSGHEPEVVSYVPPRRPSKRSPTASPNPALRRLPRP